MTVFRDGVHILPARALAENLWRGLRDGGVRLLEPRLAAHGVQPHKRRDNLLSSWTLCANRYFPAGDSPEGRALLACFLRAQSGRVSDRYGYSAEGVA